MFNLLTDKCQLIKENDIEYYIIPRMDEVQREMLRLLSIIDKACNKLGIEYWLDGGTLIGAIRHQGFIPWDDDIDIAMTKPDYIKLVNYLNKILNENEHGAYLIYSQNNIYNHCCNYLASTQKCLGRMKGTIGAFPIKLDIRPLNQIKNTPFERNNNLILRDKANYIIFGKRLHPELWDINELSTAKKKRNFLEYYNKEYGFETGDIVLAHPYLEYSSESFYLIEDFLPTQRLIFDNIETRIPNCFDSYLNELYGDYMKLPSLESRVPMVYEYFTPRKNNKKSIRIIMDERECKLKRYTNILKTFGVKKLIDILSEKYGK